MPQFSFNGNICICSLRIPTTSRQKSLALERPNYPFANFQTINFFSHGPSFFPSASSNRILEFRPILTLRKQSFASKRSREETLEIRQLPSLASHVIRCPGGSRAARTQPQDSDILHFGHRSFPFLERSRALSVLLPWISCLFSWLGMALKMRSFSSGFVLILQTSTRERLGSTGTSSTRDTRTRFASFGHNSCACFLTEMGFLFCSCFGFEVWIFWEIDWSASKLIGALVLLVKWWLVFFQAVQFILCALCCFWLLLLVLLMPALSLSVSLSLHFNSFSKIGTTWTRNGAAISLWVEKNFCFQSVIHSVKLEFSWIV